MASLMLLASFSMACKPFSGEAASPRAFTRALPTITPSAPHSMICLACTKQSELTLEVECS